MKYYFIKTGNDVCLLSSKQLRLVNINNKYKEWRSKGGFSYPPHRVWEESEAPENIKKMYTKTRKDFLIYATNAQIAIHPEDKEVLEKSKQEIADSNFEQLLADNKNDLKYAVM